MDATSVFHAERGRIRCDISRRGAAAFRMGCRPYGKISLASKRFRPPCLAAQQSWTIRTIAIRLRLHHDAMGCVSPPRLAFHLGANADLQCPVLMAACRL